MRTKSIFCIFIIILTFFISCSIVSADVIINEIAWMGTSVSANAEWIELYNDSNEEIALEGWILSATDASPTIHLSGSISGAGYYLLERTSDETVPGISAKVLFTGSLANTGEQLQLKDSNGAVIDRIDALSGWPSGDNVTKETMQWNGAQWVTGTPTPNEANVSSTSEDEADDEDVDDPPSTPENSIVPEVMKKDPVYTARIEIPDVATAGVAIPLKAIIKKDAELELVSGKTTWFLGDGTKYVLERNVPTHHIFHYPGTYTIILTYHAKRSTENPDATQRKNIVIVPASISIENITSDGGVVFKNSALKPIDINNWVLFSNGREFTFPEYSVIKNGETLSISSRTIGFVISPNQQVILMNPERVPIAKFPDYTHIPITESSLSEERENVLEVSSPALETSPAPLPQVKTFAEVWRNYQWYALFGGILVLIILAYFFFRLYANRHTLLELTETAEGEELL